MPNNSAEKKRAQIAVRLTRGKGRKARQEGKSRSDCPYTNVNLKLAWLQGFDEEKP